MARQKIKILHVRTLEIETIDRASYDDYVKKGWIPDESDLAERKRQRNDCWGLTPTPTNKEREEEKLNENLIRSHASLDRELRKAGFVAGKDFFLAREYPGYPKDIEISEATLSYLERNASASAKYSDYLESFKALKKFHD